MSRTFSVRVVAGTAALVAFALTTTAHADDAAKCAAAKMKAAAKYASCRASADAKAESTGDPVDYSKCDDGQSGAWSKIEPKYGLNCPTTGDQGQTAAEITSATNCVINRLAGTSDGSCATTLDPPCPVDGVIVAGKCWVLGAPGDSCVNACLSHSLLYDSATETYAGLDSGTIAHCDWLLDQLGLPGTQMGIGGPANVGCWYTGSQRLVSTPPVTDQGYYSGGQRVCACH